MKKKKVEEEKKKIKKRETPTKLAARMLVLNEKNR